MQVEHFPREMGPAGLMSQTCDGIFVALSQARAESPLENEYVQWIDWRMRGHIDAQTRGLGGGGALVFMPTMGALASPMVIIVPPLNALPSDELTESVVKAFEGLKMKTAVWLTEGPPSPRTEEIVRSLKKNRTPGRLMVVDVGTSP